MMTKCAHQKTESHTKKKNKLKDEMARFQGA